MLKLTSALVAEPGSCFAKLALMLGADTCGPAPAVARVMQHSATSAANSWRCMLGVSRLFARKIVTSRHKIDFCGHMPQEPAAECLSSVERHRISFSLPVNFYKVSLQK